MEEEENKEEDEGMGAANLSKDFETNKDGNDEA